MPWSAVMLGLGVGLYFALPVEPGAGAYAAAAAVLALGPGLALRRRETLGPLGLAVALVALGLLVAGARTQGVAGPVLGFSYYGAIEGRVVAIDRSASDAPRLTLDRVRLEDMDPARTPLRVRIALHGDQTGPPPAPGTVVMLTGHLAPPSGPAEPGGFDFQRHAWFLSLGAVGYTRAPVMLLEERAPGAAALFHLRLRLSAAIQGRIPGQPGAFAAAVLTGDRSALEAGPTEAMRAANIAHLLAISGLHMGLLTGFVYAALRALLALIPPLALRYPIRKWAAAVALAAGAFYLALSGGNVATERAFIQVAVMFAAVLLDRRAITLRSVAIAAILVLLHRPETLMSPGFQMSFAATAALVGAFGALRGATWMQGWPKPAKGAFALVVSSAVAGAATAPFAAAHFNQVAVYGLIANLLTVPVMGSVIIPGAVLAALLWPLGLSGPVWRVMEWGLAWILGVAERVAAWPGAVEGVPTPPGWMLGAVSLAALVVLLWQGRARWLGVVPLVGALLFWPAEGRPLVLVADSGGLVGLRDDGPRALSRARGDSFVAGIWLENDGDRVTPAEAAARPGWAPAGQGVRAEIGGWTIWHGAGRRALPEAAAACATHDLVILSEPAPDAALARAAADLRARLDAPGPVTLPRGGGCLVLDAPLLARTGALAITPRGDALLVTTARGAQGLRPWSPPSRP
ncbi:ComEC family competence protein [Roseibacterium sp. KMU-115]|uniref:ComEC family competence protein n=2 Tax=Roseicyclus persicicus TaxID=2650661 RepID=A0A7X6H1W3_9RHOB|nr:ComEC/Rec2 family competence protein [Roseibacterium persicicum]NKX45814.1 ComEC family competence protein [Roseibacterium persicicum]